MLLPHGTRGVKVIEQRKWWIFSPTGSLRTREVGAAQNLEAFFSFFSALDEDENFITTEDGGNNKWFNLNR